MLLLRFLRALWVFSRILLSYLVYLALARVFGGRRAKSPGALPRQASPWLERYKARIDQKNARRLRSAMLRLRGVYIKMGQVLSIMGGFLPRAYGTELESLQDRVPPRPFRDIERVFRASFGKAPAECFASIDEEPIAAASLGQVHAATTAEGRKLAVKVLYPGIREIIAVDMRVVRLAISVYKRFFPFRNIERVHSSLVDLLARETNYLEECAAMQRMAENFASEQDIIIPSAVTEWTTRDVLTMTFVEGFKITNLKELEQHGIEPRRIATRLVQSFYKQIFVDHFFHADPHPGNFFVQVDEFAIPRIVLLDFGAVSEVPQSMVDGLLDVLQGLFSSDGSLVVAGVRQMGFVAESGNSALLEQTLMRYFQRLLKVRNRTPSALFRANAQDVQQLLRPELESSELRDLMRSIDYPEGWFYIERASILMFWLCGQIDPDLDTLQIGIPYILPLIMKRKAKAVEPSHERVASDLAST